MLLISVSTVVLEDKFLLPMIMTNNKEAVKHSFFSLCSSQWTQRKAWTLTESTVTSLWQEHIYWYVPRWQKIKSRAMCSHSWMGNPWSKEEKEIPQVFQSESSAPSPPGDSSFAIRLRCTPPTCNLLQECPQFPQHPWTLTFQFLPQKGQ